MNWPFNIVALREQWQQMHDAAVAEGKPAANGTIGSDLVLWMVERIEELEIARAENPVWPPPERNDRP